MSGSLVRNATPDEALLGRHDKAVGVVTWNVQHASRDRAARQVRWLTGRAEADVLVLTEVSAAASGERLAELLRDAGYDVHLPDFCGRDYRVLLAVRGGAVRVDHQLVSPSLPHRFALGRVVLGGAERLAVAGIYVPSRGPRTARNVAKRQFQDAVVSLLSQMSTAIDPPVPTLIVGDLNVVEPDHQPHLPAFGAWEYDFYRAFEAAGFVDAFRLLHPDASEHSWFGRSGIGYRIDHMFCSRVTAATVTDCRYLQEPRTLGLSDHAALTARLLLPSDNPAIA